MCSKDNSLKSTRSLIISLQEELEFLQEKMYNLQTKNKELEKLSITDSLTGLYNQRHFHKMLIEIVHRYKSLRKPLYLLFFDVDNLKSYNDTYGHSGGDEVLIKTAECLIISMKNIHGTAYRCGGDEFAAILPSASKEDTIDIARSISKNLKKSKFKQVSLSFGIAGFTPDMSYDTLFKHADDAMYMAKNGRTIDSDPSSSYKIYIYD
ncbi:diguanylate cyclase [Candidatus Poribacteria bacterium]|nr:diguanylate cyclase [Candidatus Poribacteria bacterium]